MARSAKHELDGVFISVSCVNDMCDFCIIATRDGKESKMKRCPVCKSKIETRRINF